MKNLLKLIFALLLFSCNFCVAQVDTANVYIKSLKLHIKDLKSRFINNPELSKPEIYYVEKDFYTTTNLPEIIEGKKIEILDDEKLRKLTRGKRKINIISLRPAVWKNGKLQINVINFLVLRKGKKYHFTNLGGTVTEISDFKYKEADKMHRNYD